MRYVKVTIPSGSDESGVVEVDVERSTSGNIPYAITSLELPSGMEGNVLSFLSIVNGTPDKEVKDKDDLPLQVTGNRKRDGQGAQFNMILTNLYGGRQDG